jgi:pyruvate dehydrogenase E2 component (dihydrolipoamide acetyltransferase)
MDHGKVVEWLVAPGDTVHRGDLIATVDTDKTVMDVESFEDGVVGEFLVDVGETVPVGTPMMTLDDAGAPAEPGSPAPVRPTPVRPTPVQAAPVQPPGPEAAEPRTSTPAGPPAGSRVRSSPLARRLAARLGIDLESVHGTGQQGAVSEADVRRAADAAGEGAQRPGGPSTAPGPAPSPAERPMEAPAPEPAGEARPAPVGKAATLRAALGSLMAKSKATVPHYYLSTTIDLGRTVAVMQERNLSRPVSERLVPAAFLLKAAAMAAREVPGMNGFWDGSAFAPADRVHLGVAVALHGGGLVAPALHDADTLSAEDLMAQLRDLVARARAGRLLRAEMADATITVTSLGDLGVEAVFGVIVPPQVAMVGFGRVVERPWAENGMLGVRPTVTATLSADHRVSDGLGGGRYLTRIQELLLTPEEL